MKTHTPPPLGEEIDWRINNLTYTSAPFVDPKTGKEVPAGAAVMEAALFHLGKEAVGIGVPSIPALFLDLSRAHRIEAEKLLLECKAHNDPHNKLPDGPAYALIQNTMASVVFACTALESFANEMIPDSYVHVIKKKDGDLHCNKEQIERWVSLVDKLGDVLPQSLKVKTPKGAKNWEACNKLIKLRDRIVHMKSSDRKFKGNVRGQNTIWAHAISDPLPETYSVAKAIMKHFYDHLLSKPRWFEQCPF